MGTRGPVGKRSDQKHGHRTKAEQAGVVKAPSGAQGAAPKPNAKWHPTARRWFTSLAESGQSVFYEPSDWATAYYVAEAMSLNLRQGKFSAVLFSAVLSGASSLMVTEGDRRRLKLELERGQSEPDPAQQAAVSNLAEARARLEKRPS
jgi:hypothetical protein